MKNPMRYLLFMILMGFSFNSFSANYLLISPDSIICAEGDTLVISQNKDCFVPDLSNEKTDDQKKKKIVSALFAFPFPFGFVGAHRVILGTKPWIPVVYVATFGGCFGLLPLIDFCVITFSKNIEQYENNPRLFMWITSKEEPTKNE